MRTKADGTPLAPGNRCQFSSGAPRPDGLGRSGTGPGLHTAPPSSASPSVERHDSPRTRVHADLNGRIATGRCGATPPLFGAKMFHCTGHCAGRTFFGKKKPSAGRCVVTPITKKCSESIPPISHMSAETCHTRAGTCMHSQLRVHGFNTHARNLFWRFFWSFWRFFWRFFSITSAHDMHWTQSQTTKKKLGSTNL